MISHGMNPCVVHIKIHILKSLCKCSYVQISLVIGCVLISMYDDVYI